MSDRYDIVVVPKDLGAAAAAQLGPSFDSKEEAEQYCRDAEQRDANNSYRSKQVEE